MKVKQIFLAEYLLSSLPKLLVRSVLRYFSKDE